MRLPPSTPPWYLRPLHARQRRRYGEVLEPTSMWSYRPAALATFQAMFAALRRPRSPLSPALRTLVSLRVSQINVCAFCIDLHSSLLAAAGVSEDKAFALPRFRTDPSFSDLERVVLAYTEAVTATPPVVDDALFERLRAVLSPEAIVELTAVIGFQNMSARFNAALQAQAHGFCRLPQPASPASPATSGGADTPSGPAGTRAPAG
jgi:uncharacterized peroxidase-related enzyme